MKNIEITTTELEMIICALEYSTNQLNDSYIDVYHDEFDDITNDDIFRDIIECRTDVSNKLISKLLEIVAESKGNIVVKE